MRKRFGFLKLHVGTAALGCPPGVARPVLTAGPLGVTRRVSSSYNELVMSTVTDAAQRFQFVFAERAPARVLAALSRVPKALSGESAVTPASQPLR